MTLPEPFGKKQKKRRKQPPKQEPRHPWRRAWFDVNWPKKHKRRRQ
jgi:hypothetical protein